jgi:hypothetical protein
MSGFFHQTNLSFQYDFLLKITLTHDNVKQACANATIFDINFLNINCMTSDVTIDNVLTNVFTFCPVT